MWEQFLSNRKRNSCLCENCNIGLSYMLRWIKLNSSKAPTWCLKLQRRSWRPRLQDKWIYFLLQNMIQSKKMAPLEWTVLGSCSELLSVWLTLCGGFSSGCSNEVLGSFWCNFLNSEGCLNDVSKLWLRSFISGCGSWVANSPFRWLAFQLLDGLEGSFS